MEKPKKIPENACRRALTDTDQWVPPEWGGGKRGAQGPSGADGCVRYPDGGDGLVASTHVKMSDCALNMAAYHMSMTPQ